MEDDYVCEQINYSDHIPMDIKQEKIEYYCSSTSSSLHEATVEEIQAADDYLVHLETLELPDLLWDQVFSGRICGEESEVGRPHTCTECGKAYTTKDDLSIHIKCVHRDERPRQCTLCDVKYHIKEV